MSKQGTFNTLFTAQATSATATAINVNDADYVVLTIATAALTDGTIRIQGSVEPTSPTFSGAQSPTNMWDYIYAFNLDAGTGVIGATGISPAGAEFYQLKINVDVLRWLAVTISGMAAGAYTVKAYEVNVNKF